MLNLATSRAVCRLLLAAVAAAIFTTLSPMGGTSPAQAQVSVSVQFRTALEPYGHWERHARWGEVWIPADRPRDWRPYTVGHWVYTDDWGWYWIEDDAEASWGWITFHYGRWAYDDDQWVWIPGGEWGPAWVQWRRGSEAIGWAPLPPDDVIVEYRERPVVWIFVRVRDFVAPRIVRVVIPYREYPLFIQRTVVVNRTVVFSDRRYAVNPGIPAAYIAASVGRPLRTYEVRPRVLAGLTQIRGAVEVRADELQRRDARERTIVRETPSTVRPAGRVPEPQPLAAGERGRLGDTPPRAAREAEQGTQGRGVERTEPSTGRGRDAQKQREGLDRQDQKARQEGRRPRDLGEPKQGTVGRSRGEPKQPPRTEGRGGEPKQQLRERRDGAEQRQAPRTEGRGGEPKQQLRERRDGAEQRQAPRTEGRGGGEPKQQLRERRDGAEQRQAPRTEGRGGAEQRQMQRTEGRGGAEQRKMPRTEGRGEPRGAGGERRGGQPGGNGQPGER